MVITCKLTYYYCSVAIIRTDVQRGNGSILSNNDDQIICMASLVILLKLIKTSVSNICTYKGMSQYSDERPVKFVRS